MSKNQTTEPHPPGQAIVAINACKKPEWSGSVGQRFRKMLETLSRFIHKHKLTPEHLADGAVELAKDKIQGSARKDAAAVIRSLAETTNIKLEIRLKRRLEKTTVVREEAETRLAVIKAIDAEFELLKKLSEAGVGIMQSRNGKWTLVPLQEGADLTQALERNSEEKRSLKSTDVDHPPNPKKPSAGA